MEIWKDLTGYIGIYQVSNNGRIKSLSRKIARKNGQIAIVKEKILKPKKDRYGYFFIVLSNNNIRKTILVHRLVAAAFIPNPENKPYVDHIDGVKYHNFADNLRWCTQKENMNYKPARRNKIKYNCQIVGYGADGKECVRFDNYIDAEKRGMYRHLIKKSVDTGKPYKGILYKEEK